MFQLYVQIIDFFKGLCCVNTQFKQVGWSRVQSGLGSPPLRWWALEGRSGCTSPVHTTGDVLPRIGDFSLMHLVEGACPGKQGKGRGMLFRAHLSLGTLRQGPDLRGLALGRHSYMCDSLMPF